MYCSLNFLQLPISPHDSWSLDVFQGKDGEAGPKGPDGATGARVSFTVIPIL